MAGIKTYKDLDIWQDAMNLTVAIYSASENYPNHELYGLTSQLRRASVAVPSNIAEGWGRRSNRSFAQYLRIAAGSVAEMETQIELCSRLGYLVDDVAANLQERCNHLIRRINALHRSLEEQDRRSPD